MVITTFACLTFACIERLYLNVSSSCVVFTPQVEAELKDICRDILEVLDKHLIPSANTGESKVFYYKMYVLTHALRPPLRI